MQKTKPHVTSVGTGERLPRRSYKSYLFCRRGACCAGCCPIFQAPRSSSAFFSGNAEIRFYILWCGLALAGFLLRAGLYSLALSMSHKATFSILKAYGKGF